MRTTFALNPRQRERIGVISLTLVAAAWGSTFLLVKDVIAEMSPMRFLTARFLVATVVLVAVRPGSVRSLNLRTVASGVTLGLCLSGGYVFQTVGLERTPPAVSGFITGLAVVLTPLLAWPLLGRHGGATTVVATTLATAGLAVLSLRGAAFGIGEALTLLGALCYALQIVGLGAFAEPERSWGITVVQLGTVTVVSALCTLPRGPGLPPTNLAWFGVVATAVIATAVAFVVQSWGQAFISPTRAAVVFTMEPVFAGIVSWFGGEQFSWTVLVGGALVLAAMLVTEVGSASTDARPMSTAPNGRRRPNRTRSHRSD